MIDATLVTDAYDRGYRDGRAACPPPPRRPRTVADAIDLLCRLAAYDGMDPEDLLGQVDFCYAAELLALGDAQEDAHHDDPLYSIA